MSPAGEAETPSQQEQQLQTLARAFDALLLTAHQLCLRERDLRRRVEYAHDEVGSNVFFFPNTSSDLHDEQILALDRSRFGRNDSYACIS